MSAAEKLKALEFDPANIFNNSTSLLALTDALPQIVAVVEAAERARGPLAQGRRAMTELVWTQMDFGAYENLAYALVALDEALS